MILREKCMKLYQQEIEECSFEEIYFALLEVTKERIQAKYTIQGNKKLYYISSEFLIGKLLSNNLINLGIFDEVKLELAKSGIDISKVEQIENEPSLGNGGLGRLAACFLDSIATQQLPCDGIGLNYHFGLFKQIFENGEQKEIPNPWIRQGEFLNNTNKKYLIEYSDRLKVTATLKEIDILGYKTPGKNKLKLFDIESVNESILQDGINFDKANILENLTLFLYPDDSDSEGQLLRIFQQYFMVSCAAQSIIEEVKTKTSDLKDLYKYAVIQINDTHPTLVIPELIRLLLNEGLTFQESLIAVSKSVAYTNHTILAEALEKWPLEFLEKVVPNLLPIIIELDKIVKSKYDDDNIAIIDLEDRVHMANICIHFGFSINGVAALHTNILMKSELNHFYNLYPEKFSNKTNGITFRRWLLHANPELTSLLDELIGTDYKKDAYKLKNLLVFKDEVKVLDKLLKIKELKKTQLNNHLESTMNESLLENSIVDIQIKRLHEYKRQQMNSLYIIDSYLSIKNGKIPKRAITFVFGAKAAPAYTIAKDIIHLLLTLKKLIENDEVVSKYMKIVFVENYNVTQAQYLFPAADISEQISLASKEASGTGNMKFMLNGSITLGTLDGANVEIKDLVGSDNIYIFGKESQEIIDLYDSKDYSSRVLIESDKKIKKLVEFIISKELLNLGNEQSLRRLYNEILTKDWFMSLVDILDYIRVKNNCIYSYEDRYNWARMMLKNIANAGFFSSDRTISEYNADIWKLK